jgi:hypothetical protein
VPARVEVAAANAAKSNVAKEELMWLLGWTKRAERRYQTLLFLLCFFAIGVVIRITSIAFDLTAEFARREV